MQQLPACQLAPAIRGAPGGSPPQADAGPKPFNAPLQVNASVEPAGAAQLGSAVPPVRVINVRHRSRPRFVTGIEQAVERIGRLHTISGMEPLEFERVAGEMVAARFGATRRELGGNPGADGGVDGRFWLPNGGKAVLQVKYQKKNVPRTKIDEFWGAMGREGAALGVFVAKSGFASTARKAAAELNSTGAARMELYSGAELKEWERATRSPVRKRTPELYVTCGDVSALIDRKHWTIGRGTWADLDIDDDLVSRRHAFVELISGHYYLRDNQSLNGTWFHDSRIECQRIGDEDVFVIGTQAVRFSYKPRSRAHLRDEN